VTTLERPCVFLDRDGTLVEDSGYVHRPEDLVFIPRVIDGLTRLRAAGFLLIVVTNQSGVGRGFYTDELVRAFHGHLNAQLGEHAAIDAFYYCPFHPDATREDYRRDSALRKPAIGMFEAACRDFRIAADRSYMIGDRIIDMEFGRRAGLRSILVRTGDGDQQKVENETPWFTVQDDLAAAALGIVDNRQTIAGAAS
jgi:D-glycero-D-manno-heptose 1,7-bisphosphate phosphatase